MVLYQYPQNQTVKSEVTWTVIGFHGHWNNQVGAVCFLSVAFENEDDVTEFVKCKIESLMANKEQATEGNVRLLLKKKKHLTELWLKLISNYLFLFLPLAVAYRNNLYIFFDRCCTCWLNESENRSLKINSHLV